MELLAKKQRLRNELRKERKAIPSEIRQPLDDGIFQNFVQSPWYSDADTLLLYVSCGGEPDTIGLIPRALQDGKKVALPKCTAAGCMEFLRIQSMDELAPGAYGILEPVSCQKISITEKTVCVVPGVAFTPDGRRLGQGGGYYDRFLQDNPSVRTIGLCYQRMLLPDLPCEPHDKCVDAVITEKSVEVCDVIKFRK